MHPTRLVISDHNILNTDISTTFCTTCTSLSLLKEDFTSLNIISNSRGLWKKAKQASFCLHPHLPIYCMFLNSCWHSIYDSALSIHFHRVGWPVGTSLEHWKLPEFKFCAGKVLYPNGKGARLSCLHGHPGCDSEVPLPGRDRWHDGAPCPLCKSSAQALGRGAWGVLRWQVAVVGNGCQPCYEDSE